MLINEYQESALETSFYPKSDHSLVYPALGLTGESGEVADKIKKIIRDKDGKATEEDKRELSKELGDVLWYVAILANELGYTLEEVAQMNINKLQSRKERNKLHGSGDNR